MNPGIQVCSEDRDVTDGPSRAEYTSFVERVYHTMEAGFEQINERLDVLNGRTGKGEIADAEIKARVVSLEKEVFQRPRRRAEDHDEFEQRNSKREAALVAAGLAIIMALIRLAEFLGAKLWAALTATGKL
jgi:hypothetical protein